MSIKTQHRIGIVYPGEMGSSLGALLAARGLRVVSTAAGRSPRTRQLAADAGLVLLDSLQAVVRSANIIISLVTPDAALDVARQCSTVMRSNPGSWHYLDANSISPARAKEIGAIVSQGDVSFIDASIHGLASQLSKRGTMYLSGPNAHEVGELFGSALAVKIVGDQPGQASGFKMVMGGISKGLTGLFTEMMLLAERMGVSKEAVEGYSDYYPGVMEAIMRLLPTYPKHARRRVDELSELERTMVENGVEPAVIGSVREVVLRMSLVEWSTGAISGQSSISEIIGELSESLQDVKGQQA